MNMCSYERDNAVIGAGWQNCLRFGVFHPNWNDQTAAALPRKSTMAGKAIWNSLADYHV